MNENSKTGIFWGAALVMFAIAMFVAWPKQNIKESQVPVGQLLFEKFTDPLAASSMRIVVFDDLQGKLDTFEVRKDRQSGLWTIPSRDGYPADAVEQMKDAANAFVGLVILDEQTRNAEDHKELGVLEPSEKDLDAGEEGIGRLVTFKDDSQQEIASLIIGNDVEGQEGQKYVRIPGQDPVYTVKIDQTPLTTEFQTWIEEDLLQLSSIEVEDLEIKDYNASMSIGGGVGIEQQYQATVKLDGTDWTLVELKDQAKNAAEADPDKKLNKTKLDALKNALEELDIVDVIRKPDGLSANLRANEELLRDQQTVISLAGRGFYPVQIGNEADIISANGELSVGLKNGVRYIMRFGDIAGVSEDSDSEDGEDSTISGGVNRYLLVTTQVDEAKFPAPDLQTPPENLEQLKALLFPKPDPEPAQPDPSTNDAADPTDANPTDDSSGTEPKPEPPQADTSETPDDSDATEQPSSDDEAAAPAGESDAESSEAGDEADSGEVEVEGSGEGSGTGQGQDAQDVQTESADEATETDAPAPGQDTDSPAAPDADPTSQPPSDAAVPTADGEVESVDPEAEFDALTEEEKLERLEAEQEKITKDNQRKMDERKDKMQAAELRVAELNARFADWYYVIPEDTYTQLRVKRDELFEKPQGTELGLPPGLDGAGPGLNLNGLNGIPGLPPQGN